MRPPWVGLGTLEAACRIRRACGLRPHPSQNLAAVPSLLRACWDGTVQPFCLGRANSLIVLAVDGLSYDLASELWSPDILIPLTSVFPSTSVAAWLTSVTGLRVEDHLVLGAVYYAPEANALFHVAQDQVLADGRYQEGESVPNPVEIGPWPTIFSEIQETGGECIANLGDLVNWPGRWRDAVTYGAREVAPLRDWPALRLEPVQAAEWALEEVERAIEGQKCGRPLFVWTYLNLDDYVHLYGYARPVIDCLRLLDEAIQRWAIRGHTVVAYSDHGLVRTRTERGFADGWNAVGSPALCRHPPGGAGRVRWIYPRAGVTSTVMSRITDLLGEHAMVIPSERCADLGLLAMTAAVRERLGEVLVLATDEVFPVSDPAYKYEHGSFTRAEMIVPFAIWGAQRG